MARPDEYAQWIVDNQDKQGTEEFNTVVKAYEESKRGPVAPESTPSAAGVGLQAIAPAATAAAYSAPTGMAKYGSDIANVAQAAMKNVAARPLLQTVGDVAGVATHGVPWGSIAKGVIDPASLTLGQTARGVMDVAKAAPGYVAGMAGPALRGAARVAGPAGMAYNLAEAAPYLQQADIGNRTASGEIPQATQAARQAPLNAPTPAPLSPQEARNLLSSGDQRTINIYGGPAKLAQIAGSSGTTGEVQQMALDRLRQLGGMSQQVAPALNTSTDNRRRLGMGR